MNISKLKRAAYEFLRYAVVGGLAFLVDIGVLYLCKEHLLNSVPYTLYISTAIGFLAGLTTNYLLCLKYVFLSAKGTSQGRTHKDRLIFVVIGVVGLAMNEAGMKLGVEVIRINYLIVKIVVTGIVLVWNYLARKFLIFNTKAEVGPDGPADKEE